MNVHGYFTCVAVIVDVFFFLILSCWLVYVCVFVCCFREPVLHRLPTSDEIAVRICNSLQATVRRIQ